MKPSDCTFISLENIKIPCKTGVVLRKKIRKKQYDSFPHFFGDVVSFEVTQGTLQASVFASCIDCPPISLVINNCQITIYVPKGILQCVFLGLLYLPRLFACQGKTL